MSWDATLAQSAYAWASSCPSTIAHSQSGTGENLAAWFAPGPDAYQPNVYVAPGVQGVQSLGSPGRLGGEPSKFTAVQNFGCTGSVASPFSALLGWSSFPMQLSMCNPTVPLSTFSEASAYNACSNVCSGGGSCTEVSGCVGCGHWRQLINEATSRVGCATAYCSSLPSPATPYWWAVCQYMGPVYSNVNPVPAAQCSAVPKPYTFEGYGEPLAGGAYWSSLVASPTTCPLYAS